MHALLIVLDLLVDAIFEPSVSAKLVFVAVLAALWGVISLLDRKRLNDFIHPDDSRPSSWDRGDTAELDSPAFLRLRTGERNGGIMGLPRDELLTPLPRSSRRR
jgi:hypothetical protein